jgi:hypothetical protein
MIVTGCASGPPLPSADLLQRIEFTRTQADHEALAAHYDREAQAALASAAMHRKMAAAYQGSISGRRANASMPAHCDAIVRSQEAIAAEHQGMGAAHRQMGQQAKPEMSGRIAL